MWQSLSSSLLAKWGIPSRMSETDHLTGKPQWLQEPICDNCNIGTAPVPLTVITAWLALMWREIKLYNNTSLLLRLILHFHLNVKFNCQPEKSLYFKCMEELGELPGKINEQEFDFVLLVAYMQYNWTDSRQSSYGKTSCNARAVKQLKVHFNTLFWFVKSQTAVKV